MVVWLIPAVFVAAAGIVPAAVDAATREQREQRAVEEARRREESRALEERIDEAYCLFYVGLLSKH